jgi:hypothetical protein
LLDFALQRRENPMKRICQLIALVACAGTTAAAHAHNGHGLEGAHGHATDGWGLIALAIGVALWCARRK